MHATDNVADFSLLGGPLHRIGIRSGFVWRGTNSVPMGLLLGVLPWVVLAVMARIEGYDDELFSLNALAAHARLLVAIPLFFVCEAGFDPRATTFVREIVQAGVVPEEELPALRAEIERIARRREGWQLDTLCFALSVAAAVLSAKMALVSNVPDPARTVPLWSWSGDWYWYVCITLFRFLLLRMLCRLWLWCSFLWRLSKLPLRLLATHPDRTGGLGYLEVVQVYYWPFVLSISAVQAASLAAEMASGVRPLEPPIQEIGMMLAVDALIVLGPLLMFAPRLWVCWNDGLGDYAALASRYVRAFDEKWLQRTPPGEPLLGTPDLQSLADLANSIDVVRSMRVMPVTVRLLAGSAFVGLAPMLPLLLFKYPMAELAETFFRHISGL